VSNTATVTIFIYDYFSYGYDVGDPNSTY